METTIFTKLPAKFRKIQKLFRNKMEFDLAANRLKKDQDALRSRAKRRPQTMASSRATLEAKRREEYRKKQMEKKREKDRRDDFSIVC